MSQLASAAKAFLDHCRYAKSLSHHTVRAYRIDLQDFLQYLGADVDAPAISSSTVESYVQHLRRRKLGAATAKRRLGCLKVFFRWLEDAGTIATDPLDKLKLTIKLPRRLPRAITRRDLKELVKSAARSETPQARGDTDLAIMLMATTGIRVAELVSIRLGDIDGSEGRVRIHGKGNRERTVFVTNRDLLGRLKAHCATRMPDEDGKAALFINRRGLPLSTGAFRARLRKACDHSKVSKRVTPHMLRHTAATLLLEEGVDIRVVQRLLGHQSISTTEIYTHVSDQSLRKALTRADLAGHLV